MSARQIMKMYKEYQRNPSPFFCCSLIKGDIYKWRLVIYGIEDTIYENGFFPAELEFPQDYPYSPPVLTFKCAMFHPNINKNGYVCISILHKPGVDETNEQESQTERWNPFHTVESIVLSVLLMLQEPNQQSPENVEVNRVFMNDKKQYISKVKECVANSINYL